MKLEAVVHSDFDAFERAEGGAILYIEGAALIKCPGCASESACEERNGANHPSWVMDRRSNTWQPSVHHAAGCGWHGWLKDGAWEPCG